MITQALQIMLFGMLGIFIVMGLIIGAIKLLGKFGGGRSNTPARADDGSMAAGLPGAGGKAGPAE